MPKFDVFVQNQKVKVQKNPSETPSTMEGFDYIGSLIGSTKVNALTQAKAKIKSGQLKMVADEIREIAKNREIKIETAKQLLANPETCEHKKAIYSDVNGVLDDREREAKADIRESSAFYVPAIVCPHKIFKLMNLAIKHQADLVMISDWRLSGLDFYPVVARSLLNSEIPEYVSFVNENMDDIMDLCNVIPTSDLGKRTDEVRKHAIDYGYTHFVVLEDSHEIEEDLNPIMVNWMTGLQDEHIEKADALLS